MTVMPSAPLGAMRRLPGEVMIGAAGAAPLLALAFAAGLPKLAEPGIDNDSLMRLVTVRDLLAGQSWFDPAQHRMGPPGGFAMHWSRLVDAPLALLVWLLGERAAAFVWPSLLAVVALTLTVGLAARLGGPAARFPALVLAVVAFHFMGVFSPGTFDHHNVQLVLMLGLAAGLAAAGFRGGLVAGAAAAVSLAVGLETLPLVAAGGAACALLLALRGGGERDGATGFGLGFAGAAMLALATTLPPGRWPVPACDAFSGGHAATAVVAGLGLAAAAWFAGGRSLAPRLAALGATAAASATVFLLLLPACLGDPYAGLDPRLQRDWLGWVVEAQPLTTLLAADPVAAATHHATPLLALVLLVIGTKVGASGRDRLLLGIILAAAVAVSWWQLRGAVFSLALAVPVLAAWIGAARSAAGQRAGASLWLAAAWLLSFNVAWGLAVQGAMATFGAPSRPEAVAADAAGACRMAGDYAILAVEPATSVLAVSNLGAPVLAFTPHRVLAGPYHRNEAGNLATLDAFMGPQDAAPDLLRALEVGIVAVCPGNDESEVLAQRAPDGLLARLAAGETPGWLTRIDGGSGALALYRLRGPVPPPIRQ